MLSVTIYVAPTSGWQLFTSNGTFRLMLSLTYRVLVVGSGAGGGASAYGGGGSGFVQRGFPNLTGGQLIAISVGVAGNMGNIGKNSSFGTEVKAAGGTTGPGTSGGSGGSGGGAGQNSCTAPGTGGANGNNGGSACATSGGTGQGL